MRTKLICPFLNVNFSLGMINSVFITPRIGMINTIFITPRIEMVNTIFITPRIEIRGVMCAEPMALLLLPHDSYRVVPMKYLHTYSTLISTATARFLSCGTYKTTQHIFHTHFIYKSYISHQESGLIYLS